MSAPVDAGTAELILAMPCTSDDDVVRWFGLVQECHDANPDDFDAFVGQLRDRSGEFDPNAVEAFVERASGDGSRAVAQVLEWLPAQPEVYWELANPSPEAGGDMGGDPFAWMDQSQVDSLSTAWGSEWQSYLSEQLDYRWGADWQANPAEHKQEWLAGLLPELLGSGDAEQPAAEPTADDDLSRVGGDDGGDTGTPDDELAKLAEELVLQSIGDVEGADSLTDDQRAAVVAAVRQNLEESNG